MIRVTGKAAAPPRTSPEATCQSPRRMTRSGHQDPPVHVTQTAATAAVTWIESPETGQSSDLRPACGNRGPHWDRKWRSLKLLGQ